MSTRLLDRLPRQVVALARTRSLADWKVVGGVGVVLLLLLYVATIITPYRPQTEQLFYQPEQRGSSSLLRAEIVRSNGDGSALIRLLDGGRKGAEVIAEGFATNDTPHAPREGDRILVGDQASNGTDAVFRYADRFRIPGLLILTVALMALVALIGGRRGVLSVVGLVISLMIIGWMIVPLILNGYNPFWTILGSSYIIAVASILVSHGVRKRTIISIGCICLVLTIVAALTALVMWLMAISGITDEATLFLLADRQGLDIRGVVAGGMIIATLGVLDDVVTTQVATVEELHKANHRQSRRRLFLAASSVGTEHIASIINTLALAYAGASLPFILLLAGQSPSLFMVLNGEYVAVEIVRTLVASIGLIIAIPISTLAATLIYKRFGIINV